MKTNKTNVKCYIEMSGEKLWICEGFTTYWNKDEALIFKSLEECKEYVEGTALYGDNIKAERA